MAFERTKNYKLVLEYDGAAFHGWQVQPHLRTVHGCLESALRTVLGDELKIHGASRTDRGVHALGQTVAVPCRPRRALPAVKLRAALNGLLDDDVKVREAAEMPLDWHARHHALGKHYRYRILNSAWPSPLLRGQTWHVHRPLDVAAMNVAAAHLVGTRDFRSLAASGEVRETTRTITELSVSRPGGGPVVLVDVAGDGFLWNMVRTIAGTLAEVGRGARSPDSIPAMLAARDRRQAGQTAPAHGLTLMTVFYDEPPRITRRAELTGYEPWAGSAETSEGVGDTGQSSAPGVKKDAIPEGLTSGVREGSSRSADGLLGVA